MGEGSLQAAAALGHRAAGVGGARRGRTRAGDAGARGERRARAGDAGARGERRARAGDAGARGERRARAGEAGARGEGALGPGRRGRAGRGALGPGRRGRAGRRARRLTRPRMRIQGDGIPETTHEDPHGAAQAQGEGMRVRWWRSPCRVASATAEEAYFSPDARHSAPRRVRPGREAGSSASLGSAGSGAPAAGGASV